MLTYKKKIHFYDCDPAGIMFYARIYEVCHSAYEELIENFDLKENYWNNEEYVTPIIKSEAIYKNPIVNGDIIEVKLKVSNLKKSSFELSYTCINQKGKICAEVKTVHVFVNRKLWKKTEMRDYLYNNFKSFAEKK